MNAIELLNRGYTDLISVVPPHAKLSPGSAIREEDKGKSPGIRYPDGLWGGYGWRKAAAPTHAEVQRWINRSANVGLRANAFPAVDIDCTNTTLSNVIRGLAFTHLGMGPERVGRFPKRLIVYKTTEPFRRMRLWIRSGQEKHLIEILGDGQQYVVAGTHPGTRKPYTWPGGVMDAEDLQELTRDEADAWLTLVAETLDAFGYECEREGSGALARERTEIDQSALKGEAAKIREALTFLPNTNELFPGRDDYLRVGYAIKAALGEAGYPLYEAWALEWAGNDAFAGNDPDTVYPDWQRMQPPFEVGAPWLYEMAQKQGYDWAADEFESDASLGDGQSSAEPGSYGDAEFAAAVAAQVIPGESGPQGSSKGYAEYSDLDLAERFVKLRGNAVRYCEDMGKWLAWDGARWDRSGTGAVRYLVSRLCGDAQRQANDQIEDYKERKATISALGSNGKKNAVTDYASIMPSIAVRMADLDVQPYLLNTPAGIIDLRDGSRVEADPALLLTKVTAVAPAPGAPLLWLKFLREATGDDYEMTEYLQRVAGYALTGDKSLHSLHFFYGPGGNGKGTFLNALRAIWGDYAKTATMDLFTSAKFDKHPTELAGLAGARLVLAQETDEDRAWDEAKLKQLTSNDPVSARFMAKDFFDFIPTFKLLFAGNHRPAIKNVDEAMQRRVHIVPFTRKPDTPDTRLSAKLEAEYPQILQWAIEGAKKFYKDHELRDPASVHEATIEYFEEEDDFTQWLQERTSSEDKRVTTLSAALAEDYKEWAARNGARYRNARAVGIALSDHGFKKYRQGGTGARGYYGIRLTHEPGDEFQTDPALA